MGSVSRCHGLLHVGQFIKECLRGLARGNLPALSCSGVRDHSLIRPGIFHDLNISLFTADHGPLGLFGMHGERHRRHLASAVLQQDRRLFIHTGGCRKPLADYPVRLLFHKTAHNAEGIHADIKHGASRQVPVEEAVLHVVFLKASEVDSDHLDPAQFSAADNAPQFLVQRHMPDRHCLRQDQVFACGKCRHLFEFP